MSRQVNAFLGGITITLPFFLLFVSFVLPGFIPPPEYQSTFLDIRDYLLQGTLLITFLLVAFYCVHLLVTRQRSLIMRLFWLLAILLFSVFAMPFYWWSQVWKQHQ